MNHLPAENIRILAIDPTTRGFGFAVMEGSDYLIDWGVKEGRDNNKDVHCLNNISELIDRYMPDVIVVEDFNGMGSRRCHRVEVLIKKIIELAGAKNIKTHRFSRSKIREVFALHGAGTKYEKVRAKAVDFRSLLQRWHRQGSVT